MLALPAGYVVAPSTAQRDEWAGGLAKASRNAGVGVVFGIDVEEAERWGMERCPRSFVYASDRGRRLVWGAAPTRTRGRARRAEWWRSARLRATVLFGRELFGARAAPAVEAARPDLVLVLGHARPDEASGCRRFARSIELAPTLVVHQALTVRRPVTIPAPRGWRPTVARGAVRVVCYRREADGAAARVVGN